MVQALAGCDRSQVGGIAVSGQQHGLVVLDTNNNVIRPAKLWCDLESAKEAQELSETFKTTIVPSFTSKLFLHRLFFLSPLIFTSNLHFPSILTNILLSYLSQLLNSYG